MPVNSSSATSDQRARTVCTFGLIVQILVFAGVLTVALASQSALVTAESIHMGLGVVLWLCLLIVFVQRHRAEAERFETEELRRAAESGAATAIFEDSDEALHLERARLRWVYRWIVPGTGVVLALAHIFVYVYWQGQFAKSIRDPKWANAESPALAMTCLAFAGFFCFLLSRYAGGMARQPAWAMLKSASTYLAGCALACLVVVAAMGLSKLEVKIAEPVATYVIYILLLVLGIEFAINFILEIYRPKQPDEAPQPAFQSRLLALLSEPGGVARSIAESINYQFGFEVSRTWFYQLMQRSLLPLVVFSVLAMVALSSVVIVDSDQEAVIERFGQPIRQTAKASSPVRLFGPGIHFKWPWPVDRAYRASVKRIRPIVVGTSNIKEGEEHDEHHEEMILWTEKHEFAPHMLLIVASPDLTRASAGQFDSEEQSTARAVGVGMLSCSVAIEYVVDDLTAYLYSYQEPKEIMEAIAYQTLTDYAASVDLNQIMGPGRQEFERGLRQVIEERVHELDLGVRIVFLGLHDAHPPNEEGAAAAFQAVVKAESEKSARIEEARGNARAIKTTVAGSVFRADLLDQAILDSNRLSMDAQAAPELVTEARQAVDDLLLGNPAKNIGALSGSAATDIAEAQAERTVRVSEAQSKQRLFGPKLAAFQAAPDLFMMREYLNVLTRSAQEIRKFMVAVDQTKTDVIIIFEDEKKGVLDLGETAKPGG